MNYVRLACIALGIIGLGCFNFPDERLMDAMLALLFVATVGTLVTYIFSQRQLYGEFRFTPNVVIASALGVWHLGFIGIYTAGLATPERIIEYFEESPHTNIEGVAFAAVGIAAFVFGLTLGERRSTFSLKSPDPVSGSLSVLLAATGATLVSGYFVLEGRKYVGDYDSVFTVTGDDPLRRFFNLGLMMAFVGVAPSIVFGKRTVIVVIAIGAALAVAVSAAMMGTRWVFLVMLALVISALQMRGTRISLLFLAAMGVLLMFPSIVVKEMRAGHPITMNTMNDYLVGRYTHPVVEFFEETGQAVIVCMYMADEYRQPSKWELGRTFVQALRSAVPSAASEEKIERPMYVAAQDMFPVRFMTEGFTLGFSVFAEWFVNFGIFGVVFGSGLMGCVLGAVWRRACQTGEYGWTALSYCWTGYLTFGFRNDAMTWMRFVFWSAGIVVIVVVTARGFRAAPAKPVLVAN